MVTSTEEDYIGTPLDKDLAFREWYDASFPTEDREVLLKLWKRRTKGKPAYLGSVVASKDHWSSRSALWFVAKREADLIRMHNRQGEYLSVFTVPETPFRPTEFDSPRDLLVLQAVARIVAETGVEPEVLRSVLEDVLGGG